MSEIISIIINILKDPSKVSVITQWIIFLTLSTVIILSAWLVVSLRNIFHCALFLCLCFFCVAGIYILLNAEFIAAVQILIYAGGIIILILFAIMLTERITERKIVQTNEQRWFAFLSSITLFSILCIILLKSTYPIATDLQPAHSTPTIGELILTKYLLPFELASVILLIAIIGAIIFIRRG